MEVQNYGVLIAPPRPKDYILGSTSPIDLIRSINDWSIYLPGKQSQRNKITDFMDCVTMSGVNEIEMQLNYALANNLIWDEALNFFHNNNYIQDGIFSLSARFNATLNGTEKLKGNYLNAVGDDFRRDGVIAETDWPMTENMTWAEFYRNIPVGLFEKGRKSKWFFDIKYQWIEKKDLPSVLSLAPVQITTNTCPGWDSGQTVPMCPSTDLNHATVIFGRDKNGNWLNLDHYPPFRQTLAPDYLFPYNLQYIVTMKPITLRNGMRGSNVLQLQKDLNKLGFIVKEDSDYGPKTELAVKSLQNKTGLARDGIAGPKTLNKLADLNTPRSLLSAIIEVESGGDDFAEGDKTLKDHAYGCLQIRQPVCDDVNKHFGTTYKSQNCLGNRALSIDIWNKYWEVYNRPDNEDKARCWNGGVGWKQIYFKPNKTPQELVYCKNLDVYWSKVKSLL